MSEVDERIVSMKFDNGQFEKGIEKSSKSLDKFKKNMNFDDQEKTFKNFEKSINNSNLDGLATAADRVSIKFNAMAAAGYAAIQHIVDKAMNSTESLVKSLSVDQIASGWSKYAEKTSSVQTIMSATGADIETVNAQLKKLLWFADETSYSFTDMTNGIGKFTAAGQDLDKSVKAMQGISTWAAISGQKSDSASRAIYNIAQAISTGYMGVADWKSVELANMATKDFKQNVIETAAKLGKLTTSVDEYGNAMYALADGTQVTAEGMRETLKAKWFDSEVMVDVLNTYGGYADKLGEIYAALGEEVPTSKIIPDIEKINKGQKTSIEYSGKALKLMKDLSDEWDDIGARSFAAAQMAKTYEDAIEATKDATSTAWMNVFESIFGNFNEAKVYWTNFANDLWDVFVPRVIEMKELMDDAFGRDTTLFEDILSATKLSSNDVLTNLKAIAIKQGAVDADLAKSATTIAELNANGTITTEMFSKAISELKDNFLSYTIAEDGSVKITKTAIEREEAQKKSIQSVIKHIRLNKEAYDELMEAYATKTGREYMFDTIHNVLESIASISDKIAAGWAKIFPKSGGKIYDVLVKMAEASGKFLDSLDTDEITSKLESLGKGVAGVVKIIKNVITHVWEGIKKVLNAIGLSSDKIFSAGKEIGYFLERLSDVTENMEFITSIFDALASVAAAIMRPIKELFGYLNSELKKSLYEGEELHPVIQNLRYTFEGLGDAVRLIALIITKILEGFSALADSSAPTSDGIASIANAIFAVTGKIGQFISYIYKLVSGSDTLKIAFEYLGTAINFVINILSGFGEILFDTFKRILDKIPGLKEFSSNSEAAAAGVTKFKTATSEALKAFKKWKEDVLRKPAAFLEGVATVFGKIGTFFSKVFSKIVEWLSPVINYLVEQFKPVWDNFKEWISTLNFETFKDFTMWLQTMFNGGLYSGILITINRIFKDFGKRMKDIGTWRDVINNFFKAIGGGLSKALKGLGNKFEAEALDTMASAIWKLIGALAVLTLLPMDKVTVAGGLIVGIVEALAGAMKIMSSSTSGQQGKLSMRVAGFQAAIKAPLQVISDLGQAIKINAVKQVAVAVAIIAAAMAGLAIVIKKFDIDVTTIAVIGGILVGAMMAVAAVLAIIDRITEKKSVVDNSVKITTSLEALRDGFTKIGQAFKKIAAGIQFKLIASSLLTIVGAVALLALVINKFGSDVFSGMVMLMLIIAELALICKMLSYNEDGILMAAVSLHAISKTILKISIALGLLAVVAHFTSGGALAGAVVAIGLIFAEFAIILAALGKMREVVIFAAYALNEIAGVVFVLGLTLSLLTLVGNDRTHGAIVAAESIAMVVAALTISLRALSKGTSYITMASRSLRQLSGLLVTIGLVLGVLTAIVGQNGAAALYDSAIAIGSVFVALSFALKNLSLTHNAGTTAKALVKLSGALLAIGVAIAIVGAIGTGKAMAAVMVLSVALAAIAGFTYLLEPVVEVLMLAALAFKGFGAGVMMAGAGVALCSIAIAIFVGVIKMMASVTKESAATAANSIMTFITTLVNGVPALLGAVGIAIAGFFKMLASIMPSIGQFITALIGMIIKALYDNITNLAKTIVDLIINVLILVKNNIQQIVEYVLDIVIAIIRGVTNKIDDIVVEVVKLFMAIIQGFASALSSIDFSVFDEALMAIGTLAAIVGILATVAATAPLAIIGTAFLAGILYEMNILIPGLTNLSKKLTEGNFNGQVVTSMGTALAMLAVAADLLPSYGGLLSGVLGQKLSLKDFVNDLVDIVPGLVKISKKVSKGKFSDGSMESMSKAIKFLAEAAWSMPRYGGLQSAILGQMENLAEFAKDLPNVVDVIMGLNDDYADKKLNEQCFEDIKSCVIIMAEMASAMPRYGGLQSVVMGQMVSLKDFIIDLYSITGSMLKITDVCNHKPLDVALITNIAHAATALAEAAGAMPKRGGMQSWVFGKEMGLASFINFIYASAGAMIKVSTVCGKKNFKLDPVLDITKGLAGIIEAMNLIPKTGGLSGLKNGNINYKGVIKFAKGMSTIAPSLVKFSEDIGHGHFSITKIKEGSNAIKFIAEAASVLPTYGGLKSFKNGYLTTLKKFAPGVADIADDMLYFSEQLGRGHFSQSVIKSGANSIKMLAKAASALPTYGGLDDFKKGRMTNLKRFAKDIVAMSPNLLRFSEQIGRGHFSEATVTGAAKSIGALAKVANKLPEYGGLDDLTHGMMTTLTMFALDAAAMAPSLLYFSEKIGRGHFSASLVMGAGDAMKALAEAANAMPTMGGAHVITDGVRQNVKDFAKDLVSMAPDLVDFSNQLGRGHFKVGIVHDGATAITMLGEAANTLGQYTIWDSIKSMISDESVKKFASQMVDLAPFLVDFSDAIGQGSFSVQNVEDAATALTYLTTAADTLPTDKNVFVDWWYEQTTLTDFCGMLEVLGKGLVNFSGICLGIKADGMDSGKSAIDKFIEITDSLSEFDQDSILGNFFGGNELHLDDFSEEISTFVTNWKTISDSINNVNVVNSANLNLCLTALTRFAEFGTAISSFDVYAMGNFNDAMAVMGTDGITKFVESFKDETAYEKAKQAGSSLLEKVVNGMFIYEKESLSSRIKTIVSGIAGFFKLPTNLEVINGVGSYYGQGLLDGLKSKDADIMTYIEDLATRMKTTLQTVLDIHSPSRFTEWIGEQFDNGTVEGIKNNIGDVEGATKKLADALIQKYIDEASDGMVSTRDLLSRIVTANLEEVTYGMEMDGTKTLYQAMTDCINACDKAMQDSDITEEAKTVGGGIPSGIANGIEGYTDKVTSAIEAQGNAAKTKAAEKGAEAGQAFADNYATNALHTIATKVTSIPTSVINSLKTVSGIDENTSIYEFFTDSSLGRLKKTLKDDLVTNIQGVIEDYDPQSTGTDIENDIASGIGSSGSGGSSAISQAVEKKIIPALDLSKSKSYRTKVKNAGKLLTKTFKESVSSFGDKKLKMTTKEIKKLYKSLATYYDKNSKAFKSEEKQLTNILAHEKWLYDRREKLLNQANKLKKAYKEQYAAAEKAGDKEKMAELKKKYKEDSKLQNKKISKNKKQISLTKQMEKSLLNSAKAEARSAYYTDNMKKGVYKYSNIIKNARKEITSNMGLTKSANKAVNAYIDNLYRETDAYGENQDALDEAKEARKQTKKELNSLYNTREKVNKGKKKMSKADFKQLMQDIKDKEKELAEAEDAVDDAKKQIEEDYTSAFNDVWETVSDNIKDGFDILKADLETGIDLISATISEGSKLNISDVLSTSSSKQTNVIDILTLSAKTGISIFEKFNNSATESTKSLIRNMKSQIEGFDSIETNLEDLKKKGLSTEMVEYLRSMGTEAASYIKVFGRMSSAQIKEANNWYSESQKRTAETLVSNMREAFDTRSKWNENIKTLIAKGLNDDIIQTIKDKGIEDQSMLKEYMTLSDDQIKEVNSLYQKSKTEEQIAKGNNLQDALDEELTALEKWNADVKAITSNGLISEEWIKQIKEAGPKSRDILDAFMSMSTEQIVKMNSRLADLNATNAKSAADSLISAQEEKLKDYANFQEKIGTLLSRNGIGEVMRKNLSSLTINDMDTINAYLEMSDDQIAQSNAMFEKESEYTKDHMIQSYKETITATEKWVDDLVSLSGTMNSDLLKEVMKNMGIESSTAYIEAFKRLTPEEQNAINEAYQKKATLTGEQLGKLVYTQTEQGKTAGAAFTDGVAEEASKTGEELEKAVNESLGVTEKAADTSIADKMTGNEKTDKQTLKSIGVKYGKAIVNGIKKSQDSMVEAMTTNLAAVIEKCKEFNDDFKKRGNVIGYKIQKGIENKKQALVDTSNVAIDTIMAAFTDRSEEFKMAGRTCGNSMSNGLEDALSSVYNKAVNSGNNMITGLIAGVTDSTYVEMLNKAMKRVMKNAIQAARDEAGINSPSRVTAEMGKYLDEGLAGGIMSYAGKVTTAAEDMTDVALTGLSGAIKKISESVDNNIDASPVIRPVLDLSEIENGAGDLNSMLQNGYNANGLFGKAGSLANGINTAKANKTTTAEALENLRMSLSGTDTSGSTTIENTFNITGDNPREIANQVSRILQQQVERRGATWA